MKLSRRDFCKLGLMSSVAGFSGDLFAKQSPEVGGPLVVGAWGGNYGQFLRDYITKPYLDPKDIHTVFEFAQAMPRLTKNLAERALPNGSMDLTADTFYDMLILKDNNVLSKLDTSRIARYNQIKKIFRHNYAIPHIWTGRVILYNPDKVKPAPVSYNDLWNPKYANKVGVINIQFDTTIESAALISGGSLSDYEPGKKKLLELKKQGVQVYPTNEAMGRALASGDCWMCIMWQARGRQWQKAGAPIKIAYPKEGVMVYGNGFGIPRNASNVNNAYAFLNAMLEPQAQINFAKNMGYIPPMTKSVLPPKLANWVGIPESQKKNVKIRDYEYLVKHEHELHQWWNQVFLS